MSSTDSILDFIKVAHAGQKYGVGGPPYWTHPFAVMQLLPPFASDYLRWAALLHDVLEDTAFVRNGNVLVFNEQRFATLSDEMRAAKREVEVRLAHERGEANPESTPDILCSPELNAYTLDIVQGVTNTDFPSTAGLSKEAARELVLHHYQTHIIELANSRPENPEELCLAEERVVLKFADMSVNVDKELLEAVSDRQKVTWYADKYARPFSALLARAKEIAKTNGYELTAETRLDDDGQGNRMYYLSRPIEWRKINRAFECRRS